MTDYTKNNGGTENALPMNRRRFLQISAVLAASPRKVLDMLPAASETPMSEDAVADGIPLTRIQALREMLLDNQNTSLSCLFKPERLANSDKFSLGDGSYAYVSSTHHFIGGVMHLCKAIAKMKLLQCLEQEVRQGDEELHYDFAADIALLHQDNPAAAQLREEVFGDASAPEKLRNNNTEDVHRRAHVAVMAPNITNFSDALESYQAACNRMVEVIEGSGFDNVFPELKTLFQDISSGDVSAEQLLRESTLLWARREMLDFHEKELGRAMMADEIVEMYQQHPLTSYDDLQQHIDAFDATIAAYEQRFPKRPQPVRELLANGNMTDLLEEVESMARMRPDDVSPQTEQPLGTTSETVNALPAPKSDKGEPPLSRRTLLKGLGAVGAVMTISGSTPSEEEHSK